MGVTQRSANGGHIICKVARGRHTGFRLGRSVNFQVKLKVKTCPKSVVKGDNLKPTIEKYKISQATNWIKGSLVTLLVKTLTDWSQIYLQTCVYDIYLLDLIE